MLQPGRQYSAGTGYRYGFNGKENDNEVKGEGTQQDYGMRIYDPRLVRFLSTDPITADYPELTPYQFASNSPIWAIDLDGLEGFVSTGMPLGNSGHGHGMIVTPEMANRMPYSVKRTVTDFTPFIGTALALYEAYTGKEVHTGRQLEGWEKGLNIIPVIGPLRKTGKAINAIDDLKDINKAYNGISDVNKTVNNLTNAAEIVTQTKKRIGWTGKIGEDFLKTLGGVSQKYFETTVGKGGRFVDQLVNGVAYESKVGYTTLTKDIQMQIAKDAELLANKAQTGVDKVVWTFFESPVTGKAGASKPLWKALKKAGIETQIIR